MSLRIETDTAIDAEKVSAEQVPTLELSVNSLSVAFGSPSRVSLSPRVATRRMVENMQRLRETLGDVSVSLHLGQLTETATAGELFRRDGTRITSLDRGDVYPTPLLIHDLASEVVGGRFKAIPKTIGRRLHSSVGAEEDSDRKTQEGIEIYRRQEDYEGERIILRTHSGLWIENGGKMGDRLRKSLEGKNVALAVEILGGEDPHPQAHYRQLIDTLAASNEKEVPVFFDLDLAHIAEAQQKHGGMSAVEFYEDVIRYQGKLVAVTSLNQHRVGATYTHEGFLGSDGTINHYDVARVLGKGVREGRVSPRELVVVEFSPFELDEFLQEGVVFVRNFKREFEENAGIAA